MAKGKLKLEVCQGEKKEEYVFGEGDCFLIPANVRHNFLYLEDTLLVAMYDKCVQNDEDAKDIFYDN